MKTKKKTSLVEQFQNQISKSQMMILEKLPILTNLKTFYYLGMEMNANVMHVKKK